MSGPFEFDREDFKSAAYFGLTTGLFAALAYFGLSPPGEVKDAWGQFLTLATGAVAAGRAVFRWWRDNRK